MTEHANEIAPAAQDIIDRHLEAIMKELAEAGVTASGVTAGVLLGGDVSVSWCAKDDLVRDGKTVPVEEIVREIAIGIEMAT